jgi:cytochrome c553
MKAMGCLSLAVSLILVWPSTSSSADTDTGRKLAQGTCIACHGLNGIGIIPLYPNLAGQKREYLAAQMRAFRDGSRKNPIMTPMAAHLGDADIDSLAAYYESLK